MEMATFEGFNKALKSLMDPEDEYMLIWHILNPGGKEKPHYHPKATEWLIIINSGDFFDLRVGEEQESFISQLRADEVMVFLFPKGEVHALSAWKKIEYFVLRDKKDKTIYAKGVVK
jgi:hypothetical protein